MARQGYLVGLLAFAWIAVASPAALARPSAETNVIPGQYIVVYERSAEAVGAETNTREQELGFDSELRYRHAVRGFSGTLTSGQVRALRRDPEVAYVVPDREVHASSLVPVVPGDIVPTGPRRLGAATSSTAEHASGIGVAVLDSGIDLTHPDLDVSDGTNCVTPGASSDDDEGHGTHVAGSIAAKNNGSGVVGVAPGTKLWSVKVLNSSGSGSIASIVCGLDWVTANAASKNIKVLNMSLGGPGDPVGSCATTTDPLHQAVCRAAAADVLSVVAAGNDGWDFDYAVTPDVPAAYPEVLTVTALSDSDGLPGGLGGTPSCASGEFDDFPATFSNFAGTPAGAAHTIAAPGVCIRSTWPTNLAASGQMIASGTSMAAPHMAGIAALCENHEGRTATCAGKSPAAVIATLRSAAQSHTAATLSYGFTFDPLHTPIAGLDFGYLTGAFDTSPPDTSIGAGPSAVTRSSTASFQFSATEAGPRFECSLDTGAWTPCAAAQEVPGLSDGSHTLAVRAVDPAGNADPSPATRTWTLDTVAPDTSIGSAPAKRTTSASARFALASSEPGSRLACKLDAAAWAECSSPNEIRALSTGAHTLSVAAIDSAGNVDPTPAVHAWTVIPRASQIKSGLSADAKAVAKALHRFGIGKLVKRRGFKAKSVDALVAGRFSIAVSGTPKGKAGVARRALLAKGSRSVNRAGRYVLKVKLTRRGRRLLSDDRRAKVVLRFEFRDAFGRTATTTQSLKLGR